MYRSVLIALSLLLGFTCQAMARDIHFLEPLVQDEFKNISEELGAAIGFKNLAPAESLGITGFDIGVEVSAIDIKKESSYWKSALGDDSVDYLAYTRVRVRKGLPFGIDVGAMYTYVPDSNIKLYGVELSKEILEGSTVSPAIGIRGTYTRLAGVDDLDMQTAGVDASISKGIAFLTPYAGAGMLWIDSKAQGDLLRLSSAAGIQLKEEKFWLPRYFAGLKISPLPIFSITAEVEYAVRPIYSLKAAIGW